MKKTIFIITLLFSFWAVNAQSKNNVVLDKGYISDGQSHKLILTADEPSKLFVTFIEGFTYQVIVCADKKIKYEIRIYDTSRNLLFSETIENTINKWEFQFKSSVSCVAEFEQLKNNETPSQLTVLIGFK